MKEKKKINYNLESFSFSNSKIEIPNTELKQNSINEYEKQFAKQPLEIEISKEQQKEFQKDLINEIKELKKDFKKSKESKMCHFRLDLETFELLNKIADEEQRNLTNTIKKAIHFYYKKGNQ